MSQYDLIFDLKINVGRFGLYFMVPWFCLVSWSLFDIWIPYFGIMSQYDPMFDLKIIVGRCDLYFMVQWFCLISWRLFAVWTSYFRILSQFDPTFDLKINVGHSNLFFHSPMILPYILNSIFWMTVILWKMCLWHQNKFRSQWPIFHGPVIFLLLFFALRNILVLLAKFNSGKLRCLATVLINDEMKIWRKNKGRLI